jgi:hypothetical protein
VAAGVDGENEVMENKKGRWCGTAGVDALRELMDIEGRF